MNRMPSRAVTAALLCLACGPLGHLQAAGGEPDDKQVELGRSLFLREWLAGDTRSPRGDGLGPVFNDSSCVACHNSSAPGGAGPNSKNVDILSASANGPQSFEMTPVRREPSFLDLAMQSLVGVDAPNPRTTTPPAPRPTKIDRAPLVAFHPGFRTANSVVLHRFSTEPGYEAWRSNAMGMGGFGFGGDPDSEIGVQRMLAQSEQSGAVFQNSVGSFLVTRSQRNPTALFGAGLLDSISDDVLVEQARKRFEDHPEIAGRVSRLKNGKIGKFGWKAQTPSLEDFVLTACAVELGLDVPGHAQGGLPSKPDQSAKGLDLTSDECAALIAYIRNLPRPARANDDQPQVRAGQSLFTKIGCANCHTPKLGDVEGLYSDLLLHDMGQDLGDTGQYGVFTPDSSEPEIEAEAPNGGIAQVEPIQPQVADIVTPIETTPRIETTPQIATAPQVEQVAVPEPRVQFLVSGVQVSVGPNGIAPRPKDGPATRQEWRTPPLWGMRDSGPYLHDGRAATLERAIALHGGEGTSSTRMYFQLSHEDRQKLQAFLRSLAAPTSDGTAVANR